MATFNEWIESQVAAGTKRADVARSIGISRSYMVEIASGTKRPSLDVAFRIEDATGGAVPARSLLREAAA